MLNAGVGSGHEREIWAQETSVWRETMAVNLDGPFFLCRAASTDMKEGGWGRIVMVSSTSGEVGSPSTSAYTASKHGLMGLMRSVAQDLGPHGATCNAENVTVTANNVHDDQGNTLASAETTVGLLIGDVNGNGRVGSGDIASILRRFGERTDPTNFRNDIDADGHIDTQDVQQALSHWGETLP